MIGASMTAVEYGGYISIVKFVIFLLLFFPWLPLVTWVFQDAKNVGTKEVFWTAVVFGAGAAAAIIWLVTPVFIIGILFYLIAVAAASVSYVMHRNARVPEFNRVLTVEHIKGLFTSKEKKLAILEDFIFITANNNEVPFPEPKTPEFFGYKTAYEILKDAIWKRASDVVFSSTQQNYNVTYYVDGAALKQPDIAKSSMEYFSRFLKNLADLDPEEKRKPQRGKFRTNQDKKNIEWEITTAGSTAGEQIRLKQMTKQSLTKLAEINLMPEQYEQLNTIRDAKQGLFIVAGTKKSGATSTFYALLRNHDPFMYSISTLERQPAVELPNITQNIFALSDTGTTTYAKRLQAMVRMEPDIVGVAECTDSETAQIACTAAKDGKIVYVVLEADDVIRAIGKWMKLVGNRNLAADTLLGISNQRLLRKLCDQCKQAYEPNKELLRKFNIPADKTKVLYRAGKVQYDKRGRPSTCENCQGTGFVGRMGVFEIIMMNDELRNVIKQSKSLSEISTAFRRAKMLYLQQQALRRVIAGTTAIDEMIRVLAASEKSKTTKPEQ
ncbi:MAG: ATPase, T2SS/T4P/T4SS family [Phycisphaerae bacterium]|nr:ATPase, T2SS/T4P/T4SS family [Phycisphaerae bacterium]MDD5381335.1 ATPase, T2SS/T4P/T4SS family [Phycisphaerae bacterium]